MKVVVRLVMMCWAVAVAASVARGQDYVVPHLDFCLAAQLYLSDRRDVNIYVRGVTGLVSCPDSGPPAIAAEWASPPADTVMLRVLADVSGYFRDRRILEGVASAARTSPREDVRLFAIAALVGQFDPRIAVAFRTPTRAGAAPREYIMLGEWYHEIGMVGAQPVPDAEARQRVLNSLRDVAASDSNARVAGIAGYVACRLEKRDYRPPPLC